MSCHERRKLERAHKRWIDRRRRVSKRHTKGGGPTFKPVKTQEEA